MTFSDVHPGDPMVASNVQQVIDALKGTAGKGVPLAPVAVNNATSYALTVENLEPTNSRALNVLKSDGSTLIKADATGVTLGAPLTMPPITSAQILDGTIATADLANNAVTNAKLGTDTARLNLLTNGGFEIWQRGNGPFSGAGNGYCADRWYIGIAGTDTFSLSAQTTTVDAGSRVAIINGFTLGSGGGASALIQRLVAADIGGIKGKTFTLSVRALSATANFCRVALTSDGTGAGITYSPYYAGGATWQTLSATYTVPADATYLQVTIYWAASGTHYIDNAMLVVGSVAADYAPLHPADDLARCLRYYEVFAPVANQWVATGQAVATGTVYAPIKYTQKGVSPTITLSAASGWQTGNAAGGGVAASTFVTLAGSLSGCTVYITCAGGLVAGNAAPIQASATPGTIAIEANP
jgi:hypothetical protein